MAKMTLKQYKKKTIKSFHFLTRIAFLFMFLKLKITDRELWNNDNDYNYDVKFNYYNPIAYPFLLIVILASLFYHGFKIESFRMIIRDLKP